MGDMHCPQIPTTEALKVEVGYFYECISEKKKPRNDGAAGHRIVSILEATDRSLQANGAVIEL